MFIPLNPQLLSEDAQERVQTSPYIFEGVWLIAITNN
jgi:hypothetical protein